MCMGESERDREPESKKERKEHREIVREIERSIDQYNEANLNCCFSCTELERSEDHTKSLSPGDCLCFIGN